MKRTSKPIVNMYKTTITITTHNGYEIERGCSKVLNEEEIDREFKSLVRILKIDFPEDDDYIEDAYAKIDGVIKYELNEKGDRLTLIKPNTNKGEK